MFHLARSRYTVCLCLGFLMSSLLQKLFATGQVFLAPPLRVSDARKPAVQSPGFPLSLPESQRMACFNGSAALSQLAEQAGLGQGDVLLMPAYVCGAELGPFEAKGCGFRTYNIQRDLQVDLDDLNRQLNEHAVQAVLITHYFGFAQRQMAEISQLCQNHSVLLIEDCAHALFCTDGTTPVGQFGDYAIFSPRKSLPLTEGGLLVSNRKDLKAQNPRKDAPLIPVLDRLINALVNARKASVDDSFSKTLNAMTQLVLLPPSFAVKAMRLLGQRFFADWLSPELEGDQAVPLYSLKMSNLSDGMLNRADGEEVKRLRQQNYSHWLSCVEGVAGCTALIPEISTGCCPLYFPVVTSDPAEVVEALQEQGIEAYQWWSNQHPAVDLARYPQVQKLKQEVVALPVHQGLEAADIDRMVSALESCL